MNKLELVEAVAEKAGLTKVDAEKAVKAFIDTVISATQAGKKVAVSGLGTFEKVRRAARKGINPATKEQINIPAKNAPKFKASKTFKEAVA